MILRVGLTGGIASGKSTVAKMFADYGCVIADADDIVRELYEPGHAGHRALVDRYGETILSADGTVDRVRLAAELGTEEGAKQLNALIHPLVIAEEKRRFAEVEEKFGDAIVIVEATLLLESGGRDRYDRIIVVEASPEIQVERGVGRGMAADEVERRMSRQMTAKERRRFADYIVINSGSPVATRQQVVQIVTSLLLDLARQKQRHENSRA